jgi:hypothetical protein
LHNDLTTVPEESPPASITCEIKKEPIDLTSDEADSPTSAHAMSLNSSLASADTLKDSISSASCADLELTRPTLSDKKFKMYLNQDPYSCAIARPPNSFILYRREKRYDIVQKAEEAVSNSDVSKLAAEMWKNEKPEVKAKYIAQAAELRKSHRAKFPDFKYMSKEKRQALDRNMAGAPQAMSPLLYYQPQFNKPQERYVQHWNPVSPPSPISPQQLASPMTPDPRRTPYYTQQPWPRQEQLHYAQPVYVPNQVSMRPPQFTRQISYSQPQTYAVNQPHPMYSYPAPLPSPTPPMYMYAPSEPLPSHRSPQGNKHHNFYHPYAAPSQAAPPRPADPFQSYRQY